MMKNLKFLTILAAVPFVFASCLGDDNSSSNSQQLVYSTIGFEDAELPSTGVLTGKSYTTENGKGITFENYYTNTGGNEYNSGYTVSNNNNTEIAGYKNQYSVYSTMDATYQGKNFLIYNPAYGHDCYIYRGDGKDFKPYLMNFAITTYTYLSVTQGDDYGKKFDSSDSLTVIIKGLDSNNQEVSKFSFSLVRGYKTSTVNGVYVPHYDISQDYAYYLDITKVKATDNNWVPIDLTRLGKVNKILIDFDSTDKGAYGINTPAYLAIDNFSTYMTKEEAEALTTK